MVNIYLLSDETIRAGNLPHKLMCHFKETLLLCIHHIIISSISLNWSSTTSEHLFQVCLRHVNSTT